MATRISGATSLTRLGYLTYNLSQGASTAIILVNDLLHEDLKGSKKFAANLSRTGIARIICEELLAIDFDWAEIVGKNATAAGSRNAEHVANYNLLVAILTTLTRFSATESGWNAMTELAITEILSELIVFVEPPKEIFLKPENVKIKGTQSYLYANTVDLALHVCKQLCTKSKWKKLSLKVLVFIQTLGDVLQQLMRAEMNCAFLETASNIVKEIYVNDESINAAIDSENVLRQLRTFSSSSSSNSTNYSSSENHHKINTNSSFAAPRQLFSTLVPI
ncbi:unnamed protein product [Caenorhabditis angaria]|uniref:Uncharacterized protein n=1 Tax=Caenorhabditis angaria TaxID=860376 RepID=A0A9P1IG02_9PELO|nr:unnamed protein product [Caenorhabditis angaria]